MSDEKKILKCLAVDDEPHALKLLSMYIEKTPFLELAFATTSPWEALTFLQEGKADLAFLDIQMEELTGLQLLGIAGKTCPIILTTAYSEYALEGYEYQVADYLLKPFSFDRFLKAVNKVYEQESSKVIETTTTESKPKADHLFVKGDAKNKFHRIRFDEICYIEGLRNYVQFICQDKKIITLQNMKSLEEVLPGSNFVRIHKSYIINLDQIKEVEGHSVLINEQRLPIGQSYRKVFFDIIKKK